MNSAVFLEPLDVLLLRGNKLFGDPGSHGESLVPPWPSVAAGALRSRILADEGIDMAAFARSEITHPQLGTPSTPGSFVLTGFDLARRSKTGTVETLHAPPADLLLDRADDGSLRVHRMQPRALPEGLLSSAALPQVAMLANSQRTKPVSGMWLKQTGWERYLGGGVPGASDFVASATLWALDARVGIGLDSGTGRPSSGRLFTAQAVAMCHGVGFVARVRGASLPDGGSVRLGGDGRAAAVQRINDSPMEPDYQALAQAGGCRIVLCSPGLFPDGWLPNGASPAASGSAMPYSLHGVNGNIVCAALSRQDTVSGWNLARQQPKPAQRVAPAGSVYWLKFAPDTTAKALHKLVEEGLWQSPCEDAARRAEGFNRIILAPY